jgi:hypothetical protein
MPLTELPFATGFYESISRPMASQECINYYPIVPETNALSQSGLIGTPGSEQVATVTGKNRGSHVMNGKSYFINGTSLFRVNNDFSEDNLGQIDGDGRVSTEDNGNELCIVVPGLTGYIFTEDPDTLTEITAPAYFELGPSTSVSFKDGYFVHTGDKVFFISNLNQGLVYDALDFAAAEVDPDGIVGGHVSRNQLFILGSETIETFQNIGGSGFPFQRIQGAVVAKGLKSQFAISEYNNSFVWLGSGVNEKPSVWRYTGNSAQKISNSAIDFLLQEYTEQELQQAFSMTYAENGSFFVLFTLPRNTIVYDATASGLQGRPVWHERKSGIGEGERWRTNSMVEAYGDILMGDAFDGRIGRLNDEVSTEYGGDVIRSFTTTAFNNNGDDLIVSKVELMIDPGVGNLVAPGDNPQMRLSFSDDGGFNFSNEIPRSMGATGKYNQRLIWRNQGRISRSRILRFKTSESVKHSVIKLTANFEAGLE